MFRIMYRVLFLFLFLQNYKVNSTICDSECVCLHNRSNQDTFGEYVDCSYKPFVLKSNYDLPSTIISLNLSMNNLTKIEPMNLLKSNSMEELILNNNKIKELNNVFELPKLKRLDLSDNLLEFIHEDTFKGIRKLENLNLANNLFSTFDKLAFHPLSSLQEVILDNNNIGPSLREVNLFDRNGFGLTHRIKNMSIRGINLNKVPENFFADAYDLKKLIISNNGLKDIFELPFTLEYLDLSDNPIVIITMEDFTDLPALKFLKLNNLKIKEVPEFVFSSLHALVDLELERNRNLTQFSPLAFGREVLDDPEDFSLERLSIKGSRLKTIDEQLKEPFGQLLKLDLQGNPWSCDCKMLWVKKLQIQPSDYQQLRCATPRQLLNTKVMELDNKYFVCALDKHLAGITLGVICLSVFLLTIALWLFLFYPRYQSRNKFLSHLQTPTAAYTILPLSATDPYDLRH